MGRSKRLRKSAHHYMDLDARNRQVIVHSEPLHLIPKKGINWLGDVFETPELEHGMEPAALRESTEEIQFQGSAIAGIVHDRGDRF